jgi:glycolate oxidase FAD binding subunit
VDLSDFAEAVGAEDPVRIEGTASRGGAPGAERCVQAPCGVVEFLPAEMTVRCGAGTLLDELQDVLRESGQTVRIGSGGTVGGALSLGRAGVCRLGHGPVRDALLQARYVNANGRVVKAGGPTVKNVSGFDLCRLLVGARGTLGFLGEVILRTRPLPPVSRWFTAEVADPFAVLQVLYRPSAVLWDGRSVWVCLEGPHADVEEQSRLVPGVVEVGAPPTLPSGSRRSLAPRALRHLEGEFVAELGVGVVHHSEPSPGPEVDPRVKALHAQLKRAFDPTGRMNPGVDLMAGVGAA